MQSLDSLVSTLNVEDFVHTREFHRFGEDRTTWDHCHAENDDVESCHMCIANSREEKFRIVRQKGTFFYDYFQNIARLEETALPSQLDFYNKLEDKKCTDREYKHAEHVCICICILYWFFISVFVLLRGK